MYLSFDYYFDNFYYWLVAFCGYIPAAFAIAAGCYMNARLTCQKEYKLLSAAILFLLYSLMENAVIYPIYNFVPLLAFCTDDQEKARMLDKVK